MSSTTVPNPANGSFPSRSSRLSAGCLIFSSCQLFTDKIILYLFLQLSFCEFSNVFPDFLALTLPSCSYHLLTLSITVMSPGRLLGLLLAKLVANAKGSHRVRLQIFDAGSWKSKSLQSRVVNWV